jgi:hypothetical protein
MANGKSSGVPKTTFGKRKKGKHSKTKNKHDRSEKNYRGQGR